MRDVPAVERSRRRIETTRRCTALEGLRFVPACRDPIDDAARFLATFFLATALARSSQTSCRSARKRTAGTPRHGRRDDHQGADEAAHRSYERRGACRLAVAGLVWRRPCSGCRAVLADVLVWRHPRPPGEQIIRKIVCQFETPDRLRGRMIGVTWCFQGGPQLGELGNGAVANRLGAPFRSPRDHLIAVGGSPVRRRRRPLRPH